MSSGKQKKQSRSNICTLLAPDSSSISCATGKSSKSGIYWPSSGKTRAFGKECIHIPAENTPGLLIVEERKIRDKIARFCIYDVCMYRQMDGYQLV